MMRIEPVARADYPALAAFIHRHNARPDGRVRCLHADQGADAAAHLAELLALPPHECLFLAARDGDGWCGVVGLEADGPDSRAWLRGPLTRAGDEAWGVPLVRALIAARPRQSRLDGFPQSDEAALVDALAGAGFERRWVHHVMQCDGPAPPWPASVHDAAGGEAGAAAALHHAAFPEGYLSPETLLSTRDADHRLLVSTEGDAVVGYVAVQMRSAENEGYIDYLGVAEWARGRGHGRRLLGAALHWALAERGARHVSLTVQQDRAPALALYLGAGFREVAAGLQMTWWRPAS